VIRVAVVGARCRRQGIGAHLARFLVEAGAEVVAVAGTTPETAAEAAAALPRRAERRTAAYADVPDMLGRERLDALVIASPHETHGPYLALALDRGLHVLCEKPLVWGGPDPVAEAERLARAFLERDRHLVVNAQWPYTLDAYRALYPEALDWPPRRFEMRLSPRSTGFRMLLDGLPHPLSLLAAVAPHPGARVEAVRVTPSSERRVEVSFRYVARAVRVEALVRLEHEPDQPRTAAYGFDGHVAQRAVERDGYRLSLEGGGRRVPLPDPTPLLVASFVSRVSSGAPPQTDPAAVPGMRLLADLCSAYPSREPA
jgi:predicted dehydrogenase